jgi:hypothetical protein
MFRWTIIMLLLASVVTTVYAQDTAVSFSSNYTYLSRECKWAYSEAELTEGQDNALVCAGYGKYRIFIYFSAMDSWLSIQLKENPDSPIFDPAVGGIDEKKGVIEWRMADGIPFAVISRSREYSGPEEGRKLIRESLIIRGIGQYSYIRGSVRVKNNKSANEEARKLADNGYNRKFRSADR